MKDKVPTFQRSFESEAIYGLLVTTQEGDIVTYEAMSAAARREAVQRECPWVIYGAVRRALHEERMHFASVRGVGVQRMRPGEVIADAPRRAQRLRRAASRSARVLGAVDYDRLTAMERVTHNAMTALFRVVAHVSGKKGQSRMLETSKMANHQIAVERALDAFREGAK